MFTSSALCDTSYATLHMAGDINHARQLIRKFCDKGACIQLTPCDYIYTRGLESGFTARVINYPRIPKGEDGILDEVTELGKYLGEQLCQKSFSIETSNKTYYFTDDNFNK